jgi:hypothetical protein
MNPVEAIKANRHTTCEVVIHGAPFVFRIRRVTSSGMIGSSQMRLLAHLPPEVMEKLVTGKPMPEGEMGRELLHKMKMMSPDFLAGMVEEQRQSHDEMLMLGVTAVKSPDAVDWTPIKLVPTEDDAKAREVLLEAVQSHSRGGAAAAARSFRRDASGGAGDTGDADDAVPSAGDDGPKLVG